MTRLPCLLLACALAAIGVVVIGLAANTITYVNTVDSSYRTYVTVE